MAQHDHNGRDPAIPQESDSFIQPYNRHPSDAKNVDISYRATGSDLSDYEESEPTKRQPKHGFRWWTWLMIKQFAALAWLAPIIALLMLNFKQYLIGASAWCPGYDCIPGIFQLSNQYEALDRPFQNDKDSHNLLGGLQFAAKALEVWFTVITTALVYRMTILLAGKRDGLPIGYLYRASEYTEVLSLFDGELWFTPRRMHPAIRMGHKWRVAIFVAMTIFFCAITNLMGPAVAVLVLPTLQWINTEQIGNLTFGVLNAGSPPATFGAAWNDEIADCSAGDFTAQRFSCAQAWTNSVDALVSSWQATEQSDTAVFTVQDELTFSYNATSQYFWDDDGMQATYDLITFIPSRWTVQNLTDDMHKIIALDDRATNGVNITSPDETYSAYINTVQTYVHRRGPILGALANMFFDFNGEKHWTTVVDETRSLRCYAGYNLTNTPLCWGNTGSDQQPGCADTAKTGNYTRCIATGAGWENSTFKEAAFGVEGQWDQSANQTKPSYTAAIYASSKAAFLPNGTLPTGISSDCIRNGTIPSGISCDWDMFFNVSSLPDVQPRSRNVTTIDFLSHAQETDNGGPSTIMMSVDFVAYMTFAQYSFDPSWVSNPSRSVTVNFEDIFLQPVSVAVDPAWLLAGYAANANNTIPNYRDFAVWLDVYFGRLDTAYSYNSTYATTDNDAILDAVRFGVDGVALMPIVQALSLIDYTTVETSEKPKELKQDSTHPKLDRFARIYVWAYSTGSRTSKFGIVVAIIGCLIVSAKIALSFAYREDLPSPLQLLTSALEHRYDREFHAVKHEKNLGPITFRLHRDESVTGGVKFTKLL